VKVDFKGGRELQAAMQELGQSIARNRGMARRALDKAAEPIQEEWVRGVDVLQGDLRRSIKIGDRAATKSTRRFRRGGGASIVERFIGIDASEDKDGRLAAVMGSPGYAWIEEFGNGKHAANPAGRNAWETKKGEALDRVADDLRVEIAKVAKKARKR
jgi:hypothetical protein